MTADVHLLLAGRDPRDPIRVGMGFLIGPHHVLTCAHVVAESLRLRDVLRDQETPPDRKVTLALAFSSRSGQEEATIEAWWPERSSVGNWPDLDDVALLKLPDGFVLPPDVSVASYVLNVQRGQTVYASGVTAAEQNGVGLRGQVLVPAGGNRHFIRSEQGDGVIAHGYSGAAVTTSEGLVVGMMTDKQQTQTGLFIRSDWLLRNPRIKERWQAPPPAPAQSFIFSQAGEAALPQGVANAASEWLSLPIRARLQRHLHDCDRSVSYGLIEDLAMTSRRRSPAIGIFGCEDDDMPECFYDRFQSRFLVEAGHAENEIAHPPRKWEMERIPWRKPGESVSRALAPMKRALVSAFGADGPDAKSIRRALKAGRSQAFYSELRVDQLGPEDETLLTAWSAYLAEIGKGGLHRSLVHLICLKPAPSAVIAESLEAEVRRLAGAGDADIVVDLGLLPVISDRELTEWIERVARRVPLQASQIYRIDQQARTAFSGQGPPRLRQLERWLDQLNDQDP